MKTGLVLEGGGMRGMFTCGVIDFLQEQGVTFDGLIGVSAGAAFGCNYKSRQIGRALRYNKRFAGDARYMGVRSLLKSGSIVNAEFAYHIVPTKYDIFDYATFRSNPMTFHLVCTDVETGKTVYHELTEVDHDALEWIRATASMPGVSVPVPLSGRMLLDGGITDSIPLKHFQEIGYERNVVVLTQPLGYEKHGSRLMDILLALFVRKYPAIRKAMKQRPENYNRQLAFVRTEEQRGTTLVIAPDEPLGISRLESNPDSLQRVYDLGRKKAENMLTEIQNFISSKN